MAGEIDLFYHHEEGLLSIGKKYGASPVMLLTKDGRRNVKVAIELARLGYHIILSGKEHGFDAWFVSGEVNVPIEIKTSMIDNPFCFNFLGVDRIKLANRLASCPHIYAAFNRPNEHGIETINDVKIVWPGSWIHSEFGNIANDLAVDHPCKIYVSMQQIARNRRRL